MPLWTYFASYRLSLAWHIKGDSGINTQTQGVLAELNGLMQSVFVSEFAKKGTFSIRRFIRNRGGKTAFLLYDLRRGSVLAPIYRIMIDLALKEALSSVGSKGSVYILADELKLAPHLQYLETGITFGRSKGLKVLAGTQSITQLKSIYPESVAENIIGNFGTTISFFSNDPKTRSHISEKFGKNYVTMSYEDRKGQEKEDQRAGFTVEDWDQYGLGIGDAIIGIGNHPPYKFHFNQYPHKL